MVFSWVFLLDFCLFVSDKTAAFSRLWQTFGRVTHFWPTFPTCGWTLITTAHGVEENEDGFSHGRIYLLASKHPLLI